ncbi:MBL fold metallo-hydrolase [Adhaeribacter radiodurans]|uniref:MBL fold metallo-hydrolase n=1 Tax=Adhaeribacter radiodurans TaxID=2745197 RepID=A0A7L7LAJ0_9BACT|nr:MBL fold metallo-hydrolase [Adhaeribacter radiodurans]QMU29840.1 MBL fold metallo-hydrolase [Adhaeribacter radiodurans]
METTTGKLSTKDKNHFPVAPGVTGVKIVFVNLFLVSNSDGSWVLVDAGLYGSAGKIKHIAEGLYGKGTRPSAIILTHGHFDHVGALKELAAEWQVPIYAHPLEMPYLTGLSSYPPPDSSVGGGAMAYMAWLYPKKPIDVTGQVQALPSDGSVPSLPGWRWLHTPGHTAGHVSLFRDSDRTLIVGDAFSTREPESAIAVVTDRKEIHGPPAYYTSDWEAARSSVEKLADLRPETVASGHGMPMQGETMLFELDELVHYFDQLAVPTTGRYVNEPAVTDERGVVKLPPPVTNPVVPKALVTAGLVALAGMAVIAISRRKKPARYLDTLEEDPSYPTYSEETTNNYP